MPPLRTTKKWTSIRYAIGYVEDRNGVACLRYKGMRKSTGYVWHPNNRAKVIAMLDQWITQMEHPELTPEVEETEPQSSMTLYRAIDEFRHRYYSSFSLAKRDNYDRALNSYIVVDMSLHNVSAVETMLASRNNKVELAPNTRNKYLGYLSLFFDECVRTKWIERNPIQGIGIPHRMQKMEILIFTQAEVDAIVHEAEKRTDGRDYALLYRFQAMTGIRIGETLKLWREDIEDKGIMVQGKGRLPRIVPIDVIPGLRDLLDEILALEKTAGTRQHGTEGKLFRWTDPGKPRLVFNDVCTAAKVDRGSRTLHTLRGTAGWWMENVLGWDERTICDVLGQEPETRKKHYRTQPSAAELEVRIARRTGQ
ncbi:MAG: site-specific integrase [Candidatus Kapaibacterium sp.]